MDILEFYQNQIPTIHNYIIRKMQIPSFSKLNLFGVRGSGKTSMILDYIETNENTSTLYIDFDTPTLIFRAISLEKLQIFIDKEKITLLILDHYQEEYFPNLPKVETLIVLSRIALKNPLLREVELFPLDYEEFLAFENTNITNKGFQHFLRLGTLPYMVRSQKNFAQALKLFFQSSFTSNEQKLLLILAKHHTKHLTTHQIYTYAKEEFKVSKDWLYKTIKLFTQEKLIFFINDSYQKSGKKMILFDFAFAKYLTINQPFIIQFDTMVALALQKHSIEVKTLGIHGYITHKNELIIPAPFESEESIWVKSQNKFSLYKQYHIKKVTIITVTNHYNYSIEKINFEALPFDEWSIINNEEE